MKDEDILDPQEKPLARKDELPGIEMLPEGAVVDIGPEDEKMRTILPHEWLLDIVRGSGVVQKKVRVEYDLMGDEKARHVVTELVFPTIEQRISIAKSIANYYAPKLVSTDASGNQRSISDVIKDFKQLAKELPV